MSDVEALDWLDRLLAADEPQRQAALDELARHRPELHARLRRLLASALAPDNSRVLAAPVLDGVARLADATRSLRPGDELAGYRLIRELGRGGMSVVWLAERADGVLKRGVAFKMPMFMLQGADDAERFARERDALAALSHPNVARLYDAGVLPGGQPFMVLECVHGMPITVHCDVRRLDVAARLRLFLQVLAAVEHAHKHLIVHRDLKPSNVLVDQEGQVKLLDFGIAKLLGESESATPLTQALGAAMTPLYAAPEQLHGRTISTVTDVYSLGVVLHELLTGSLPYRGSGPRATLVEVLEAQGRGTLPRASQASIADSAALARARPSAAKLRGEFAGDLDTIVSKALRIAPDERYGSAAHLRDDLRRFLDHEPIAARRPTFWYAARLALVRHRIAASAAAIGLALALGASAVAWMQYRESRAHAERTAAVRDFMFDLVNDAEASENQQGEVTGRQMLDGAVARARRDFGAQPQLQGELLSELGRMYMRLDAAASAVPVLEQSIAVLERHTGGADPALNKSRAFLADALLQTGDDLPRIRALAMRARDACSSDDVECAKARAYAGNILSRHASYTGDGEAALAAMRGSARDTEFAFGPAHEETAMAYMSLAIMARSGGQLAQASEAMQRAITAADGLRMRAADRVALDRTMAVIDLDLGRYPAARDRLLALLSQPAGNSERSLQLRLLANVYTELGDGTRALHNCDAAVALLDEDGDQGIALTYLQLVKARALGLTGEARQALAQIDVVLRRLREAGRTPRAVDVLRAERYRAEFLAQAGRDSESLALLRELRDRHAGGGTSPIEFGLLLDALGGAEQRAGNAQAARLAHEAAHIELARQLPGNHPFLVRNQALRQGA